EIGDDHQKVDDLHWSLLVRGVEPVGRWNRGAGGGSAEVKRFGSVDQSQPAGSSVQWFGKLQRPESGAEAPGDARTGRPGEARFGAVESVPAQPADERHEQCLLASLGQPEGLFRSRQLDLITEFLPEAAHEFWVARPASGGDDGGDLVSAAFLGD